MKCKNKNGSSYNTSQIPVLDHTEDGVLRNLSYNASQIPVLGRTELGNILEYIILTRTPGWRRWAWVHYFGFTEAASF